jgi:uncharacterized repeat protein (TIGR03803 family)
MLQRKRTCAASLLLIFPIVLVLAASAFASNETVLYSFPGGASGANSYAGLVADSNGSLYGTTGGGGSSTKCNLGSGCGTVFVLTAPSWKETVLYSFQGQTGNDGSGPQAGLIFDSTGALYGTTASGGKLGFGTVFKLTPPAAPGGAWTETILYSFKGAATGANPASGLIFDGTALVGTTPYGGKDNFGTVFKLTPTKKAPWTEAILYNFTGLADGGRPYAGLLLNGKILYGTTLDGGPSSQGAVFQLSPPAGTVKTWTETVIYGFTGGVDGGKPYSDVTLGKTGILYGTTGLGGTHGYGTVFELTPGKTGAPYTESVLYSFSGGTDGAYARYGVIEDAAGNLYGTTGVGASNAGVVFELIAPTGSGAWKESILWSFTGSADGGDTTAGLLLSEGMLYGTTSLGGQYSDGTVFSAVP